jgi:hypothetical protein
MDIREELKSAGAYPSGPVSAWPQERNKDLYAAVSNRVDKELGKRHATKVKASTTKMAGGLLKATGQALRHGKVSAEIREERYDTCKTCPAFIEKSKRCSECGCFMEAKTWIGGDKDMLCPLKKWSR